MSNTQTDAFGNDLNSSLQAPQMIKFHEEIDSYRNQDWNEKWSPNNIDEILLAKSIKEILNNSLSPEYGISSMTFCSSTPGTCKTTTAITIAKQLGVDYKLINASESGTIDTVRNEIVSYGMQTAVKGNFKIVILDEIDSTNNAAFQDSLRGVIDRFKHSLRFILTCNSIHKVTAALLSRCPPIYFNRTENPEEEKQHKNDIYKRLLHIAIEETKNKDFVNIETIKQVIVSNYPDVRVMVAALQSNFKKNGGKIDGKAIFVSNAGIGDIWNYIVSGNWEDARVAYNQNISSSAQFFREFLDYALSNVDKKYMKNIALLVAEYQYRSSFQVDQEMNITCGLFPSLINYLSQTK